MAEDWIDNLPKLLPSWQGCIPKYFSTLKRLQLNSPLPDYAGTGIDVAVEQTRFRCEVAKHGTDQVNFGAQTSALPFLVNEKAHQLQDPCLENVTKQIKNYEKFSSKLYYARKMLNYKHYEKFRKDILTSHAKIKNMYLSGQFEKLSLSQNVVDMANIIPQANQFPDKINFHYSGGCLAVLNKNKESPILLHPVGPKLNKLASTHLVQTSNDLCQAFKPDESRATTIKLKGGVIQQIKPTLNDFCYIKQDKQCHLVNLSNPTVVHQIECPKQNAIKIISPSPYIPTEYISIYEDGQVALRDVEESDVIWETNYSHFGTRLVNERPFSCDFGSHPRSILYLGEKEVYAVDLRLEEKIRDPLISCYHSVCLSNESFLAVKRSSVNTFQHLVASNHHLFLCDERYSAKPILIWNHQLNGSPLYCDITTYDATHDSTDAVILLGTQDTQEITSFFIRSQQSRLQTVSLTPPLSLSTVTDWVDSLQFHGHPVDDKVVNLIANPTVGVCAVPHYGKSAFTAFQVTSIGDVFYQDFEKLSDPDSEKTYKVGMGCVLAPPRKILPHLHKLTKLYDEGTDEELTLCNLNHVNIDIKDFLKAPQEISDWCSLCKSCTPNYEDKIVFCDTCPSCGLNKLQSESLTKCHNELGLLIGSTSEGPTFPCFDNVEEELSRFTDHYSKKVLDIWISDKDAVGPIESEEIELKINPNSVLSNTSYSALSTQAGDFTSSHLDDSKYFTQPSSRSLFEDVTFSEMHESDLYTQDSVHFIPSSQSQRPKIGETLRSTKKKSKVLSQFNSSSAGF